MDNFRFLSPTEIIFGKDTENLVGEQVKRYASKVLLHYGGGSIKRTGLYDRVVASLKEHGIEVVELGDVLPNPRLSLVHEGIELCRREGISFILAVGGGSVIDSAKAIGVGVPYPGDVWDFYAGKVEPKETLP
ncbi:MAG TPA: iron-containing alcohol dehydrogenase, partial [Firmicutes bacterium]|nr:iron-containing alcohol dehydrogenase [Bacillota bacterium]